jgi:hypothetical protein
LLDKYNFLCYNYIATNNGYFIIGGIDSMQEKTFNLEITAEEFAIISVGIGLYHKDCAKALYETLEGIRPDDKCVDVAEFDNHHKILMNLYDKLTNISNQITKSF